MFSCPQWGVAVGSVAVNEFNSENSTTLAIRSFSTTSCDSLVRVCVPFRTTLQNIQVKFLSVPSTEFFVQLAEMTFYDDGSSCPPETVLSEHSATTEESPDPTDTTQDLFTAPRSPSSTRQANPVTPVPTSCPTIRGACPSCFTSNSRATVVTAMATILLAAVIFVLVQVAVWRLHKRVIPVAPDSARDEEPVYEQVGKGVWLKCVNT